MLVKRIILLFFRDKANVFFSLLAVLIILGLYVLFLGSMMEQALQAQLGFVSDKISIIMASIMLGGMVAVTSVTGCMGALGISIEDKKSAANDFLTSPAPRWKITMGYILGSAVVGFIMTFAALVLSLVYIQSQGGSIPVPMDILRLLLTVMLSVLCGNSMVYFLSVFIRTQNAFSSAGTVIGTLIGFLMGIYIPIGQFPDAVQWVIKCFPMSHAASMFRQVLADAELSELFAAAPVESLENFREVFGVVYTYGGFTSGFWFSAVVLAVTSGAFYIFSLAVTRAQKVH
jgi:multidrug/hemolysin transport system permease protein